MRTVDPEVIRVEFKERRRRNTAALQAAREKLQARRRAQFEADKINAASAKHTN